MTSLTSWLTSCAHACCPLHPHLSFIPMPDKTFKNKSHPDTPLLKVLQEQPSAFKIKSNSTSKIGRTSACLCSLIYRWWLIFFIHVINKISENASLPHSCGHLLFTLSVGGLCPSSPWPGYPPLPFEKDVISSQKLSLSPFSTLPPQSPKSGFTVPLGPSSPGHSITCCLHQELGFPEAMTVSLYLFLLYFITYSSQVYCMNK